MILTAILLIIGFTSYSIMAVLQFHYESSIFTRLSPQFWDPKKSWVNKWSRFKTHTFRERFPGSSTIFVFLTDAYHLFQFITLNSLILALSINIEPYHWIINFIVIRIIYAIVFNGLYNKILVK
jgi:hypothetical protein